TPEMAQETHKEIRNVLADMFGIDVANDMTIQYGGSMKPENAKDLLGQADIDGGLVGGASLKAESFFEIIKAGV
ncbi:triose-phosphate isomerase, partial [Fusobacterium sp.]